jgi:hypothetical protein
MSKATVRRNGRAMFTFSIPVHVDREDLAVAVLTEGIEEKWNRGKALRAAKKLAQSYGGPDQWPQWEHEDQELAEAQAIVDRLFPELLGMERILRDRETRAKVGA